MIRLPLKSSNTLYLHRYPPYQPTRSPTMSNKATQGSCKSLPPLTKTKTKNSPTPRDEPTYLPLTTYTHHSESHELAALGDVHEKTSESIRRHRDVMRRKIREVERVLG
ncbi:hypothetical protein HYALB_00002609 [Hymenoscyphus albidus]|uniref:Uncharacterized protein n=1 Tax=Hymenoscyphus albidus TaxID=595503 RepID=A0A9N9LWL0_9HELO|nr:hypothetical protein HYALB_00002609 [Hymenoscyphus albidus]